jgi:hypothetical protein
MAELSGTGLCRYRVDGPPKMQCCGIVFQLDWKHGWHACPRCQTEWRLYVSVERRARETAGGGTDD